MGRGDFVSRTEIEKSESWRLAWSSEFAFHLAGPLLCFVRLCGDQQAEDLWNSFPSPRKFDGEKCSLLLQRLPLFARIGQIPPPRLGARPPARKHQEASRIDPLSQQPSIKAHRRMNGAVCIIR
eukprot:766997-Hanusia_phi.AAC.7